MKKLTKIILSLLLIYECVMGYILVDYETCSELFNSRYCNVGIVKLIVVYLVIPCVLFCLYLLWEKKDKKI